MRPTRTPAPCWLWCSQETVCRFCGVSYLIFKEVKMLEKKLKSAENKFNNYKVLTS